MKLKFKATGKDWLIFAGFALVLLYIVAIGILNINSFAITGMFYGMSPFQAFSSEFLLSTIVFYLAALIVLFVSVSSYFFDREKGIGISTGDKNDKGYSRWATQKEMKESLQPVNVTDKAYQHAGLAIINDGKTLWVDDGEAHNLVIGSTGSGKTECVVHPMVKTLAKKGESMIITDPKAEIYRENIGLLKEKGYNIIVLNFREPQKGNTWNPLSLPYNLYRNGNPDKAMELLDDLALNILYEEGKGQDPFWEKTAADYFAGITLGLFEDAKEEEVNINSVSLMTSVGEEKYGPRSTYIKEYFNEKDPAGAAYTCASATVYAPEETKGSIISTFKQKVRLFASRENLSEMLSTSNFDMSSIGKQKTAVFMVIQDEKKTYHALATIFVKQCYETLIDVAQEAEDKKLPIRTNFILDEFANMPPLKDVTTMVTAGRSRLIRFTFMIQNFAQLNSVYGTENAQTIRSNCENLMYLITSELSALKEISELCGEVKSKEDAKTASTPLVTVSDLQRMKKFEVIVLKMRKHPFKTKLTPNFQMDWGLGKYPEAPFVQRDKTQIKVFDLKNFINEKRKKQMNDMIDGQKDNPMFNMNQMMPSAPTLGGKTFGGNPNFNVDDLVKKIDQKIAELEAEEKAKEQQLKNKEQVNSSNNNEALTTFKERLGATNTEDIPKKIEKPPVKITEDQFFDDFFDE